MRYSKCSSVDIFGKLRLSHTVHGVSTTSRAEDDVTSTTSSSWSILDNGLGQTQSDSTLNLKAAVQYSIAEADLDE